MKKLNFKNIVWKEDKYYVAQCLNVDVSSFGATKIEALGNLQEAVSLYFDEKKFVSNYNKILRPEITTSSTTLAYA